jgi:hypothetical protein
MRTLFFAFAALVSLSACGEAGFDAAVKDLAKGASEAASGLVTTQTACTLAGQSEAFCGCLQSEIGAELKPGHVEALTTVLRQAVGGDVTQIAQNEPDIAPQTREAIGKCAVQSVVSAPGEDSAP